MDYEIIKENENTWRIENQFVRAFVLEGSEKSILIDSCASIQNAKEIAESITDKPLMLINTHGDGDHTAGNGAFSEYFIGEADYTMQGMAERYPNSKPVFVTDGQIIELGERPVKIITIPGHTYGSVAILDINSKTLFAGDSVQDGTIFMFGDKRDRSSYENSLKKLISMKGEFDSVYGSHSTPKYGADQVDKVLADWQKVISGELTPEKQDMFGREVNVYKCDSCGFFME